MAHEYDSEEYYAQTFRDFVRKHVQKNYGIVPDAEQSGNTVQFNLARSRVLIKFSVGNTRKVSLEMNLNGSWTEPETRKLHVIRSKGKGIVLDSTYTALFDNFILPYYRKAAA